ncbi:MAG: carboxypeptidase-like regulatory domain-containing protein [Bacteroidaceae bacterium]|nr:carboxypeptidase-like regulatory domain-containing protein [Bacteroidaceae bacterium]
MNRKSFLLLLAFLALGIGAYAQHDVYVERNMKEVTVKPKRQRYHRKGNPAVELMQKVIAAKGEHDLSRNDFVSYYKYQRITAALNNISQGLADTMKILQSPLLKRQIEFCPQTGKYILPLNYTETAIQHLYRRQPKQERNYVLGTNSEGITDLLPIGETVNTVISSIFTDVNIYDDQLTLLERRFTSPLSSRAAISFFRFFIEDTLEVDNQNCIQLSFVPQNPQDFGFSGRLWILNDSTYRVHKCNINLPVRSSVNYITNLVLQQRFTDLPNGQRVLQTDDLFAELGIIKGQRMMMVHRSTNYTAISTDSIPPDRFAQSDKLREGTTIIKDSAFWARHRVDTLSWGESGLQQMASTMIQRTRGNVIMYLFRAAICNYFETNLTQDQSRIEIGPVMSMISHNFIDGYRFRVGGQTTAKLFPHFFFKGYAAYGVNSHRWYGMAEAEYSFLRKQHSQLEYPRHSITAQWQEDVFSPADLMWQHGRDKDNVWVSFKTQTVDHMLFRRHALLRYEVETNHHLDFKLQLRASRQTPCGSLFYKRLDGTFVKHLNATELLLSLRWAPGEEIITSKQRRHVVNHNNPVFAVAHTFGFKGILGGEWRYNTTELTAYERLWLNSYGRIDFHLRAAAQWNRVPFPHLLMPVANNSYIITRDMFCMINNLEFIGDRYLSFQVEWDLSGKILNRIPLIKRLKWREVIGFKMLYSHLTDRNNPSRHLFPTTLSDGTESYTTDAPDLYFMPSRDGQSIVHPMSGAPYMEASIGLHNVLKIFRFDYVRRINYLNYPGVKKHGFRFALQFDF